MIRHATLIALIVTAIGSTAWPDDGLTFVDRLGTSDRGELAKVVDAIDRAPPDTPDLDEALFAAARACEDTLADPARALALYDRLLREFPDARRSSAAATRGELLRAKVGPAGAFAAQAADLARLVAEADRLDAVTIRARAEALAHARWPGAPDAALWLAEWLRRGRHFDDAQAMYADVITRWPSTPQALAAARGATANAIEAHDWDLAESLGRELPATDTLERVMREDLLADAAAGRRRDRWQRVSLLVLALVGVGLVASLVEAKLRGRGARGGGGRFAALRPPIEVTFLLPVAAVLVAVALTTHELIAPAVLRLAIGGMAFAWISGATLETLRARGRAVRARAIVHVLACLAGVAALVYILLVRDNLIDMVVETVRFGPSS